MVLRSLEKQSRRGDKPQQPQSIWSRPSSCGTIARTENGMMERCTNASTSTPEGQRDGFLAEARHRPPRGSCQLSPHGAPTNPELTLTPDHSSGADQLTGSRSTYSTPMNCWPSSP